MRTITSTDDLTKLVESDTLMMDILRAAQKLNLPDWWIGAGFLRNKVWDYIENVEAQPIRDIDLVYFDSNNVTSETDWNYDTHMKQEYPFAEWEIRNQARMHYKNGFEPFSSTEDGIAHWIETATCVAVKLVDDEPRFLFCYGTDDLFDLIARPTPYFTTPELIKIFYDRVESKHWQQKWPDLKVIVD